MRRAVLVVVTGSLAACSAARREQVQPTHVARPEPRAIDASAAEAPPIDAGAARGAEPAEASAPDADAGPPPSPLATMFDGDPSGGPVRVGHTRCAPACLDYPDGWIATDDGGMVYTWLLRGEGQFTTVEVMRCPAPKLDDAKLALFVKFAGGDKVTWSAPVEGTVGRDHARALIAEGTGTARGKKARFYSLYVDVAKRKDLVIAWVADGEPEKRTDEMIAVVRSVRLADGAPPPR